MSHVTRNFPKDETINTYRAYRKDNFEKIL